ncbi:MAG: HEPN domain-containing protein [Chloroflexi bacterium]|nr:HEPN domain-containing protein [Chloroflexota bacterium]
MSEEYEIDVEKHINYWREEALDSWTDAVYNIKGARVQVALFSTHLAVEKILKAHVVKKTKNFPPMIHNLLSLARIAGLTLTSEQTELLAILNPLNIETRYPGVARQKPTKKEAEAIFKRTKAVFEWLIEKL